MKQVIGTNMNFLLKTNREYAYNLCAFIYNSVFYVRFSRDWRVDMEIQLAKGYIIQDIFNDLIIITSSFETFKSYIEKDRGDYSLFAIFDTSRGKEVFEVDAIPDEGLTLIKRRFMHFDSFMKFNNDCQIIYK